MTEKHWTPTTPMLGPATLARVLPFVTYMAFMVAADLLARLGVHPDDLRWLYGVKIGAVVLVLLFYRRHYTELHSARLGLGAAIVALLGGVLVLVLWVSLDAPWMIIGSPAGFDPTNGGRIDWPLVAVRIFGAALVVPVMEELFWRSFLMRWIADADFENVEPAKVGLKAFVVTSLLFGFEHNLWLAGIVAGAAFSALYVWHRTLWSPILAHATTNGLLGVWIVYTGNWHYW